MKLFRLIFIFSLPFLLFCNIGAQITSTATEAYGDRLIMGWIGEPPNGVNPFDIKSSVEKDLVHFVFGPGLIENPDKFATPPLMIDRFVYSSEEPGNRIWRIVLKRNILFHDGSDLRNRDVKFTFDVLKKYGGHILNRSFDTQNIRTVSTEGDLELIFDLYRPDENFDLKIADIPILSNHYYEEILWKGYEVFQEKRPMGVGPFIWEYQHKKRISLKSHPLYYAGRPFLDGLEIRFYEDPQQAIDALTNGEIDYLELEDGATAQRLHQLMGGKILVFTIPRPETRVFYLLQNLNQFPLSLPEVRQAIFYGINLQQLTSRLMGRNGRPAYTLIPETNEHFYRQAFREEYNPDRAQKILFNAGWRLNTQTGILEKAGRPLSFELNFTRNSFLEESIARAIKIYLGELNINVQPIPVLPDEKKKIIQTGDFQALIDAYEYYQDQLFRAFEEFYFDILRGDRNRVNYRNGFLDRLFDLSYRKPEVRENLYQRFQYYIRKDLPVIFLFFDEKIIVALNSRFHNSRTTFKMGQNYFYRLNPLENWFVPKDLQKIE